MTLGLAGLGLARLALTVVGGCSSVAANSIGIEGPCTRSSDCGGGLSCVGGVCSLPDAGESPDGALDSGVGDAALDGNHAG
jgi:hypothetical protein